MIGAALLVGVAVVAGCGGGKKPVAPAPAAHCRQLALHGRTLIDAAPQAERAVALRPVYGAIDLCQRPGLAARSRSCLLEAPTLAAFTACPVVTEDVGEEDPNLSCSRAVQHAMELLRADGSRPRTRDGRVNAREEYRRGCEQLNLAGRRCVIQAEQISAVHDCYADTAYIKAAE